MRVRQDPPTSAISRIPAPIANEEGPFRIRADYPRRGAACANKPARVPAGLLQRALETVHWRRNRRSHPDTDEIDDKFARGVASHSHIERNSAKRAQLISTASSPESFRSRGTRAVGAISLNVLRNPRNQGLLGGEGGI